MMRKVKVKNPTPKFKHPKKKPKISVVEEKAPQRSESVDHRY